MQTNFWTMAGIWLSLLVTELVICYIKNGDLLPKESNLELSYASESNLGTHYSSWRLLSSGGSLQRNSGEQNAHASSLFGHRKGHHMHSSGSQKAHKHGRVPRWVANISETLAETHSVPSWESENLHLRTLALPLGLCSKDMRKGITVGPLWQQ